MIVEIIKQIKEARDLETNKDSKAGLQKALVIVLQIDRENDQKKLQELQDKFKNSQSNN